MADPTPSGFDTRLRRAVHREPAPDEGRDSEACRHATAAAYLGLWLEMRTALRSPSVQFLLAFAGSLTAVALIAWGQE